MAVLDPIYATPLAVRIIPNVDPNFAEQLKLKPEQKSIGLITADNDDATYVAIDEATKMADVEVVYARSFYAGAKHSSGLISGEILAVLAGPNPAEIRAGLSAALNYMKNEAIWYSANEDASIAFFPHLISRTGTCRGSTRECNSRARVNSRMPPMTLPSSTTGICEIPCRRRRTMACSARSSGPTAMRGTLPRRESNCRR